jgi:hypothetical protein
MMSKTEPTPVFNATPVIDLQLIVDAQPPSAPPSYAVVQVGPVWLAHDPQLRVVELSDLKGRRFGRLIGFPYSEFDGAFLQTGAVTLPVEVADPTDLELRVLPRLAGMYLLLTEGQLPPRLYADHGGSMSLVYSPPDRRAASSPSLLLDEAGYRDRFLTDLHQALVLREGASGWISGTLTAHRDVRRLLPNHYLDLTSWTAPRYWPRPGDFTPWRDLPAAADGAALALKAFTAAACDAFDVAVTMTAGFDSRLLLASCRDEIGRCEFFTLEAGADIDTEVSRAIARRFGLTHRVMPLKAANEAQMAAWDRAVGDCMLEAPRRTHRTLFDLTDRNAIFTGMYGEVGRCRLYRQDYLQINAVKIDARFVVDRLTLPRHPELLANIEEWFASLAGQPNSVILDLAFHELKFASWAMGQRPITNSVKLNLLPFAQRRVLDAFIGVAPAEKTTEVLFWAIINRLWPELAEVPINKYGDARDYLEIWKKVSNPNRVRRFLRDRLARKTPGLA